MRISKFKIVILLAALTFFSACAKNIYADDGVTVDREPSNEEAILNMIDLIHKEMVNLNVDKRIRIVDFRLVYHGAEDLIPSEVSALNDSLNKLLTLVNDPNYTSFFYMLSDENECKNLMESRRMQNSIPGDDLANLEKIKLLCKSIKQYIKELPSDLSDQISENVTQYKVELSRTGEGNAALEWEMSKLFRAAQAKDLMRVKAILKDCADKKILDLILSHANENGVCRNSTFYDDTLLAIDNRKRAFCRLIDRREKAYGHTALTIAVGNGYNEIADALLQKGADVNYRNRSNETALDIAVKRNDMQMVKLLLDYKPKDIPEAIKVANSWRENARKMKEGMKDPGEIQTITGVIDDYGKIIAMLEGSNKGKK